MKNTKTSLLNSYLKKLKLASSVLLIDGPELDANFGRAARNLPNIDILNHQGANVMAF